MEKVILVNEKDEPIGEEEKMKAHEKGILHRAFSVLVFNSKGELMMQKRAKTKYHSGGLWSNTCCSHPWPGEELVLGAKRRLREEMGFECELMEVMSFIYKAELDHGLIENEFDHVLTGRYDGEPMLNLDEAEDWRWISLDDLYSDLSGNPGSYTEWFKVIALKIKDIKI